jgi:hypothetical protein
MLVIVMATANRFKVRKISVVESNVGKKRLYAYEMPREFVDKLARVVPS